MMAFLAVFAGGGLGSVCRFGLAKSIEHWMGNYPYATLGANVLSSLVLGFVIGLNLKENSNYFHLFFAVGFCGGFSTYSTFTHEVFFLFRNGQTILGLGHIAGNLFICLSALALGLFLATIFNKSS